MLESNALSSKRRGQHDHRFGGPLQWIQRRDLRSDVDVDADWLQSRTAGDLTKQRRGLTDRDAELVRLQTRGNAGVALRVDVGIDPQRHARDRAMRHGALVDPFELARRFDIDGEQPHRHRAIDLADAFSHAGEDDFVRTKAASCRDLHFAQRIGIRGAAERANQADDALRRVGFQRIVNPVRAIAERIIELAVRRANRSRVVHVAWCSERRSDVSQSRWNDRQRCKGHSSQRS
jgi:hypothetical protein